MRENLLGNLGGAALQVVKNPTAKNRTARIRGWRMQGAARRKEYEEQSCSVGIPQLEPSFPRLGLVLALPLASVCDHDV